MRRERSNIHSDVIHHISTSRMSGNWPFMLALVTHTNGWFSLKLDTVIQAESLIVVPASLLLGSILHGISSLLIIGNGISIAIAASCCIASATTLVPMRNTRVFRTAAMGLTELQTLWQRITHFPSPRRPVVFHTCLRYVAPGMWWRIHTIRRTFVLHSSQGLQLCCCRLHNTWRWLWLALAECHLFPLRDCYISDAVISPYVLSFEMLPLTTIQSLLRIHRLPLHLLRHYRTLQVWNILSNLHTL